MPEAEVCTFNIRHGLGLDGRVDIDRAGQLMARISPDLIALQEVDRFNPRSGGVDQVEALQRATGFEIHFVPAVARDGWEYGIALGTRRDPIEILEVVSLPQIGGEEPRKALVARWRGATVIGTHLSNDISANPAQEKALAALIGSAGTHVVALGDLNRTRRHFSALKGAGLRAGSVPGATVHPWWRRRQIDHVLVRGAITIKRARTVPTTASDHRPLLVSLRSPVEDVLSVTYDA